MREEVFLAEATSLSPLPDEHWVLGEDLAHCSLWWKNTPDYPGHRLGLIGHYFAQKEEFGRRIIEQACLRLSEEGCTLAIAPFDQDTWHRYRFLTERGDSPLFFLEPDNPNDYPSHFTELGFEVFATYCSCVNEDLSFEDPRIPAASSRLEKIGVSLRNVDPDRFHEELSRIYRVCAEGFRRNFLYSPISEDDFIEMYEKIRPVLRPELVFIAEQNNKTIGFLFAIPDLLQPETLIIKTVVVLPERRYAGLGNVMWARTREAARQLGYRREIHALMFEGNSSLLSSSLATRPFRRYSLFARPL
ncbi:MAG TPA: N-acetyltransferase [Cyanobacteria bacterium UBA8530]|nr:N-acetyltransferase [Cyanobacteria bacterium UBA8530]